MRLEQAHSLRSKEEKARECPSDGLSSPRGDLGGEGTAQEFVPLCGAPQMRVCLHTRLAEMGPLGDSGLKSKE
jgi:hypothetical protein